MRSREEIEAAFSGGYESVYGHRERLMLELLLDVRDLLVERSVLSAPWLPPKKEEKSLGEWGDV